MARRSTRKRKVIPDAPVSDEGILKTEYVLPEWKLMLIHAAIIIVAGLWIYSPSFHGSWVGDDSVYISQNQLLKEPDRLWKAWFEPGSFIEYYPIEQTVQWVQWQSWGEDTLGYHLTNVFLHLLGSFLVWRLLSKLGLRLAWLGGLIFAIHPMMVESVAWISELKNTLSVPPFLLAMCAWIDYEEHGKPRDYFLALGLFLLAMLCKVGMAAFPAVILLYAWWRRGRIGPRDFFACAPFLFITAILVSINIWSGSLFIQAQMNNPYSVGVDGFFPRLVLAGQILSFYFAKCFWPFFQVIYYPKWNVDASQPLQYLPLLVMAVVVCYLWWKRRTWGRHVLLGLGFFTLVLSPFLGFIDSSYMTYTWTMDHFLYIPLIGIIGVVVAGIEDLDAQLAPAMHPFSSGLLTVLMGLLALESHWYNAAFTSDETFWNYVIDRNPAAWSAHENLGKVLLQENEPELAKQQFFIAILQRPDISDPYRDLASAYMELGQNAEAIAALQLGMKKDPDDPLLHNNMGIMLDEAGKLTEAQGEFESALRRRPLYLDAHNNLGHVLLQLGHIPEAIGQFRASLQIDPWDIIAHDELGVALGQSGRIPEAIDEFEKSLQLNPNDDTARQNLAKLAQEQLNAPRGNGTPQP